MTPNSLNCGKIRFGEDSDGGYVIANHDLKEIKTLISFGVGPSHQFEKDFLKKNPHANIHLFDHTIKKPMNIPRGIHFHQHGIGPVTTDVLLSLEDTVSFLNIKKSDRCLLKMDVEGDEWNSLKACEASDLRLFDQLIIEFHHWRLDPEIYLDVYRKLAEDFYVIHVHGNNHAALQTDGHFLVPEVLEVTYARKDLNLDFQKNRDKYPTPLDFPNDPTKPEIPLNFWPFLP